MRIAQLAYVLQRWSPLALRILGQNSAHILHLSL